MNKNSLFLVLFIVLSYLSKAQEFLVPLSSNINYYYDHPFLVKEPDKNNKVMARGSATTSLFIPFKEDFYYAYRNQYPDKDLWADSMAYVNSGFAKAPLSYGVATFDGLNKFGYPYEPFIVNPNVSRPADTLTSRSINLQTTSSSQTLQPSDNVALIFYYQAGGKGDYPEPNDSLILDFYKPNQKVWAQRQWWKNGPATINSNDSLFKRAFIRIKDTALLQDGFRFRFRSYANTAADYDHWNVDYIYLDRNRDSIADTSFYDIAIAEMPTPVLKNYSAMPFKQYVKSEMAARNSVRVRSNYNQNFNFTYNYLSERDAISPTNTVTYSDIDNLRPFRAFGYSSYAPIANPKLDSLYFYVNRNYDFPMRHSVALTGSGNNTQLFLNNDTVIQYLRFRNYYAFDDGSAEAAYYVLGTGGRMAVKIRLNKTDTLLGAQIYFSHVGNTLSKQSLRLNVWDDGGNGPGALILSEVVQTKYNNKSFTRAIPEYTFTLPQAQRILNPGIYYVGFQQMVATGINVGFDVNYDHRDALFFDSGSGWTSSKFYGSLMLHPVFGSFNGTPIGVAEQKESPIKVLVYPNPTNDHLNVSLSSDITATAELYSVMGQKLAELILTNGVVQFNTAELSEGLYVLTVKENNAVIHQQKIVIRH